MVVKTYIALTKWIVPTFRDVCQTWIFLFRGIFHIPFCFKWTTDICVTPLKFISLKGWIKVKDLVGSVSLLFSVGTACILDKYNYKQSIS
jgi:hypothetical protein